MSYEESDPEDTPRMSMTSEIEKALALLRTQVETARAEAAEKFDYIEKCIGAAEQHCADGNAIGAAAAVELALRNLQEFAAGLTAAFSSVGRGQKKQKRKGRR